MHKIRKGLSVYLRVLLCAVCLAGAVPITAAAAEQSTGSDTVRVGWYEDSHHITGPNGERSGYSYEYEQAVAAYTGWNYEYVKGDWGELLDKLENGEIDLMGAISYTDERADSMLFSELPMGEERYYLYADLVNTDISASKLSSLNGRRIAVLEKSIQADQFNRWEKEHRIKTLHVDCDSLVRIKALAEKHEIDGVMSAETPELVDAGMSAIASTGGSDMYFGINKDRSDLKDELDEAMRRIEQDNPFYADELYKRYLSAKSVAVLDENEKQWIESHGNIRIGFVKDDPGISSFSNESGEIVGVLSDYIAYAHDCFGENSIGFDVHGFDSQEEQLSALEDGSIDMIFRASRNPYEAERNKLSLSNTVLSPTRAAVTGRVDFNENAENRIAVEKDNIAVKWYVSYNYPQWRIIEYETFKDAENAVRNGEADCFITSSGKAADYNADKRMNSVFLQHEDDTSFAVRRNDTVLLSILNKTLETIPSSSLTSALFGYDNSFRKVTAADYIKDNLLTVTVIFVSVFLIIMLIILASLKKSQRAETKAKEAAEHAQELNKRLQESHNELESALLRAESANAAKTTFLNNMSHDIRTPMNAIIGFTNIALRHQVCDAVRNCLEKISDSSELLLTLINDVLDISRIESGKVRFNPVIVDITEVTDSAVNVTKGLIAHRDLHFIVKRDKPDKVFVRADSLRIREILVNILGNAVKFTGDGGYVELRSGYSLSDDGSQLIAEYVISDTGIGMSEEFLEHIFDEFSQENSGARTQYKGTGLGMTITKRYIDMMGGSIDVQSKKNKGSTFTVRLPLEVVNDDEAVRKDEPVENRDLTGVKVLLAEDNDLNAEIAIIQLEELGLKLTRAADGKEAVRLFKDNPPGTFDIILMDVMMPEMNGYEATAAIRKLPDRPDGATVPIIAMTANAFAEDVQASIDAGMNGHLSKPIVIEEVTKAIARNIGK